MAAGDIQNGQSPEPESGVAGRVVPEGLFVGPTRRASSQPKPLASVPNRHQGQQFRRFRTYEESDRRLKKSCVRAWQDFRERPPYRPHGQPERGGRR